MHLGIKAPKGDAIRSLLIFTLTGLAHGSSRFFNIRLELEDCGSRELVRDDATLQQYKNYLESAIKLAIDIDSFDTFEYYTEANNAGAHVDARFGIGLVPMNAQELRLKLLPYLETCDGRRTHTRRESFDVTQIGGSESTSATVCAPGEFTCQAGECVPVTALCNNRLDCADGSDEMSCPSTTTSSVPTCALNQTTCQTGECVPITALCNNRLDCADGSDEINCAGTTIPPAPICALDQFTCQEGVCIPITALCNKRLDCTDGSDEMGCNAKTPPLIVRQPTDREILFEVGVRTCESDRNVVIDCEAEGNPSPSYRWEKDEKELNLEDNPRIYMKPGQGSLVISAPTEDDAGMYECFASNKLGITRSNPIFVRQMELSTFKGNETISIRVEEGKTLKISCGSAHASSKSRANWYNQTIRGDLKHFNSSRIAVDPDGQLWFFEVRKEDHSHDFFYICVFFSILHSEYKIGKRVVLIVTPKVISAPSEKTSPVPLSTSRNNTIVMKGQEVEMSCIFSGSPWPNITWTRQGGLLSADRVLYENHGTTLRIPNVILSDKGIYRCEASNGGEDAFHDLHLVVYVPPYFTEQPMREIKSEGETAEFRCEAGGTPSPEIKWIHNGAPLHAAPPNPRRRLVGNSRIVIENLTTADTANYGCNATNSFSYVYKDVYLNVLHEGSEIETSECNTFSSEWTLAYCYVPTFSKTVVAVTCVVVAVLVAGTALFIALCRKYNQAKEVIRNLSQEDADEFYFGKNGGRSYEDGVPVELFPFTQEKRIRMEDLVIEDTILGEGHFGIVHKGRFNDDWVAVKSVKSAADIEYFKAFLQEIKLMAYIDEHDNVVRFHGAVVDKIEDGICYAVLELSPLGNLNHYLRTHSKEYTEIDAELMPENPTLNLMLSPGVLLQFCKQIATGMEFLAEKKVIHGDLATRNILVYENSVVKVTDFGLSTKLYNCANYTKTKQVPLPWRWMAIESLRFLEFSTKSDVWSFGVTMWEIFSLSQVPFSGQRWTNDLADKLESGLRLSKPKRCCPTVYDWMMRCWANTPHNRPTFTQCKTFLSVPTGSYDDNYYAIDRHYRKSDVGIV